MTPSARAAFVASLRDQKLAERWTEAALEAVTTLAREAWPALELDDERYLAHLARHLTEDLGLADIHAADLFLACACLHRVTGALELFDRTMLPRADPVMRRYEASDRFLDEVRQELREKLFLPPPRIAEYSGRGSLVAWLRAVAARTALNHLRPEQRLTLAGADELDALPAASADPELAILRGRYRDVFRSAFSAALEALEVRERAALKLNALDGLSLERIGTIYARDKATISRWIANAQEVLLRKTRINLRAQLGLSDDEVESLMYALHSQLASSLGALLRE